MKFIDKLVLLCHSDQLSVSTYKEYYDELPLHPEEVNQYQVDDDDLKHLLLSPRSRLHDQGYECCESCYGSLHYSKRRNQDNPPKYAIANSFVIGHLPEILSFKV